jgi:hypothetical protein
MRAIVFALIASAASSASTAAAQDDLASKIINVPAPAAFRVDGTKGTVRKDETVQWGKALRIQVPGKSAQAWAVGVASPITKPVKAGDKLILAFWARLEKGENGATSASLPYNAVQLASAPYAPLFHGGVTVGPEWKLHEIKGAADKDYPADSLNVAIHLATGKQTVDLGPVIVLNMGQ